MMFSSVRMMATAAWNNTKPRPAGPRRGRIHQHEHMAVLKIDAAALLPHSRRRARVRPTHSLALTDATFLPRWRAQMHPRPAYLLQLAQLAIVGKINRNHKYPSFPANAQPQRSENGGARSAVNFAGRSPSRNALHALSLPFCVSFCVPPQKSPRASKDSSVHEVPAEQELYYY
jgi:hypothetical protein